MKRVLWWGRFDPDYSRNRILRRLFTELGWVVDDFHPKISRLAGPEACVRRVQRPDLVWVPCFRQRDVVFAGKWARSLGVPLVFDPLISAYDKQVDERGKLQAGSARARRLLEQERRQFASATYVVADTRLHAEYYREQLKVHPDRLAVIYVGAEQELFRPFRMPSPNDRNDPEVLFYGSFIALQAPQVIIEAARLYTGPPVRWTLIGNGPLFAECKSASSGLDNVSFESWVPYEKLPARIAQADILLGIFGDTPKAGRVIPNKVYQSLACGRPVITRRSDAYPARLLTEQHSGIRWIDPASAGALADAVKQLLAQPGKLPAMAQAAAETSRREFSVDIIRDQLSDLLVNVEMMVKV